MGGSRQKARQALVFSRMPCEAQEVGAWLAALDDSRERTHQAIDRIGSDEIDRLSAPSRNTIGTLLYHIAAIELDWLYSEILEEQFPTGFRSWFPHDVRDSVGTLTPVMGESLEQHKARLKYVRSDLVQALVAMSLAEFRRVRHLEAYDVTPEWVVHHLLQHEAQHRGQITMLRESRRESKGTAP